MNEALKPVLVLSLGRSGSTYIMNVLGTSPDVIFDKVYPFERRYLTHWCQACRVIGKAPDKRFNFIEADTHAIGPLPFPPSSFLDRETYSGELLAAGWEVFSRNVRQSTGNISCPYYAEKVPFHVVKSLEGRIAYRFITLLRDPRDIFLSIKNFNSKRKKKAFGWKEGQTELEYASEFSPKMKAIFGWARRANKSENGLLLRYEDAIRDPQDTFGRIGGFLGTTVKAPESDKIFAVHGTSASPSESLGAWRKGLDSNVARLIERELEAELKEFGYSE